MAVVVLCACSPTPVTPSSPTAAPAVVPATENRPRVAPTPASLAPQPASDARAASAPAPTPIACCSTGGNAVPNGKPYDSTFFENPGTNPFVDTADDHLATFGMDVDTAAYAVMRRFVLDGHTPDPDSVRVEEYVNAFDYHYEAPKPGSDFGISIESGASPFNARNDLVQVGVQARRVDAESRKPASLTFVVDTSGSMNIQSRLGTVKQALHLLVDQMRPDDRISIVTFGSDARQVLGPTSGADKGRILQVVDSLATSGSTSIDAGLREGFAAADTAYGANRINMVLLCTDGVANNGVSDADGLLNKYRAYLDRGIQLSVFGFGMGNYNDVMLEKLGDKGNGSYAYIDSMDEARRVFVTQLTGTLQTIARDAKIQVDFNPDVVSRYRLLGYEDRDIADKDFRNDRVDGGEVGAGKSVTALFEITRKPGASGAAATVHIRYQLPDRSRAVEQAATLASDAVRSGGSPRLALAGTVALYAEVLKHTYWSRGISLGDVATRASQQLGDAQDPSVRELVALIQRAAGFGSLPQTQLEE